MFKEDRCTVCGECLTWCPYMEMGEDEGKEEFQNMIQGKSSRVISQCVSCMGCDEICPEKANPFSLIVKRQEEQSEADRFEKARKNMEGAYSIPSEIQKGIEGGPSFETGEDFSQWLIKEKLISTVPWDDAGAYVRFSVTFSANGETEERKVMDDIASRLTGLRLIFD